MTEREWDRDSNEPENQPEEPRIILHGATEDTLRWTDVSASGVSFVYNDPIRVTNPNLTTTIGNQPTTVEPVGLSFDFRDSSWGYVFKYMLSWIFAPILMVISKMFRREITFRMRRRT